MPPMMGGGPPTPQGGGDTSPLWDPRPRWVVGRQNRSCSSANNSMTGAKQPFRRPLRHDKVGEGSARAGLGGVGEALAEVLVPLVHQLEGLHQERRPVDHVRPLVRPRGRPSAALGGGPTDPIDRPTKRPTDRPTGRQGDDTGRREGCEGMKARASARLPTEGV